MIASNFSLKNVLLLGIHAEKRLELVKNNKIPQE